ncbi:MAG: M28 family peptidase, partial [Gemmatimonadaceae bacterium]
MSFLQRFAPRALLLIASFAVRSAALPAQDRAPHNDAITAAKLRADLMFLGGDSFRGRLTNTAENNLALEWIASRFEAFGLKGAAAGSYYQPYNLITATLGDRNELEIASGGAAVRYGVGSDFYPHRHSVSGSVTAPVVFAGYGISAPSLGFDDLPSDVRGKILLVLDHEPGEADSASPFDGLVTSEYANQLKKTLAAQEKGAAGVLFVSDVHAHAGPENFDASARNYWPVQPPRVERYLLGAWAEKVRIPSGQISTALAHAIVSRSGKSLVELARAADNAKGSAPIPLPGVIAALITSVQRQVVRDRNVVAMLEGTDSTLKNQWVVITGHPDHDGALGDQIWNGADDNGSGTVGLVAIAEAYAMAAKEGRKPRRSILFAAFNSEERGLLGAWAFTEAPLVPLQQIVAVLNMDMIGRNE